MSRLRATLAALILGAPLAASAADVTRIASSFEDDDPFDLILDVNFERTQNRSKLLRAQLPITGGGTRQDVSELWYKGVDSRLNLGLTVGLWRDFQFSFGLPIIFQQNERWDFTSGTTDANSTIINNCLNANGTVIPGCEPGTPSVQPLFLVPNESFRGGLGNLRFGLAYAFFNQAKDDTKPMWIVGLDYEAPTAKLRDPSMGPYPSDSRGAVGDRIHRYTLYTALSRQIGLADPYFKAQISLPVLGPGAYSNCSNPNLGNIGTPANCGQGPWTRKETGIHAPTTAGFVFGSEFRLFEDKAQGQRLAMDLRTIGNYVGEGRYYNELTDVLRRLNTSEDYFQVGGMAGVTASATDTFKLHAAATFLYNTDHSITAEPFGMDLNGNGTIDPETDPLEVNPNFDYRTDMVSRQFRVSQSTTFRFELGASFSF
ncbi:hypothetical protein P2318_15720 [Myxococcaceae bacterium GXIMD 01537]